MTKKKKSTNKKRHFLRHPSVEISESRVGYEVFGVAELNEVEGIRGGKTRMWRNEVKSTLEIRKPMQAAWIKRV